jgi:hypothetical protein
MNTALNQHVLVLNRLWQAVNVCTARRALTLLFQGQAQVVLNDDDGSFRTFNFQEWRNLSDGVSREESVHTISFRIRVPRIILLLIYDRLPKKEVKFTRHNIFERDKNTWARFRPQGFEPGPRHPARPRRPDDVGKHRLLLHRVQHAEGQPHAAGGRAASHPQAQTAQMAPVRPDQFQPAPPRQLETFR